MNPYYPKQQNPTISRIPNNMPDYQKQIYTPSNSIPNDDADWYDEPDYTQAVAQGMQEVLEEGRPQLSRSEAEEQMHLAELRRQAEGYDENDAIVISEVLAKRYPWCMFNALNNEFFAMKETVDTISNAVTQ